MFLSFAHCPKFALIRKVVSSIMTVAFLTSLSSPAGAQLASLLPQSAVAPVFMPPLLKGVLVHAENPFLFDFVVSPGQEKVSGQALKDESQKLVKFFLTAMTIPDKEAWVNLSPYEKDRIIPPALGETQMGQVMLEQDYALKQMSSAMTDPRTELGQKFWQTVRQNAQAKLGTTDVPMSTFNKVWIVPGKAQVAQEGGQAYVTESSLKVMMEEDYEALQKTVGNKQQTAEATQTNKLTSEVFRTMILPKLQENVNTSKEFSGVRQIYEAAILAVWYKQALKESLLGKIYADKSKVKGIESLEKDYKQGVYARYLEAFKQGAYNFIKEEADASGEVIPRRYFSGGAKIIPPEISVDGNIRNVAGSAIEGDVVVSAAVVETKVEGNAVMDSLRKNSEALPPTSQLKKFSNTTESDEITGAINDGRIKVGQEIKEIGIIRLGDVGLLHNLGTITGIERNTPGEVVAIQTSSGRNFPFNTIEHITIVSSSAVNVSEFLEGLQYLNSPEWKKERIQIQKNLYSLQRKVDEKLSSTNSLNDRMEATIAFYKELLSLSQRNLNKSTENMDFNVWFYGERLKEAQKAHLQYLTVSPRGVNGKEGLILNQVFNTLVDRAQRALMDRYEIRAGSGSASYQWEKVTDAAFPNDSWKSSYANKNEAHIALFNQAMYDLLKSEISRIENGDRQESDDYKISYFYERIIPQIKKLMSEGKTQDHAFGEALKIINLYSAADVLLEGLEEQEANRRPSTEVIPDLFEYTPYARESLVRVLEAMGAEQEGTEFNTQGFQEFIRSPFSFKADAAEKAEEMQQIRAAQAKLAEPAVFNVIFEFLKSHATPTPEKVENKTSYFSASEILSGISRGDIQQYSLISQIKLLEQSTASKVPSDTEITKINYRVDKNGRTFPESIDISDGRELRRTIKISDIEYLQILSYSVASAAGSPISENILALESAIKEMEQAPRALPADQIHPSIISAIEGLLLNNFMLDVLPYAAKYTYIDVEDAKLLSSFISESKIDTRGTNKRWDEAVRVGAQNSRGILKALKAYAKSEEEQGAAAQSAASAVDNDAFARVDSSFRVAQAPNATTYTNPEEIRNAIEDGKIRSQMIARDLIYRETSGQVIDYGAQDFSGEIAGIIDDGITINGRIYSIANIQKLTVISSSAVMDEQIKQLTAEVNSFMARLKFLSDVQKYAFRGYLTTDLEKVDRDSAQISSVRAWIADRFENFALTNLRIALNVDDETDLAKAIESYKRSERSSDIDEALALYQNAAMTSFKSQLENGMSPRIRQISFLVDGALQNYRFDVPNGVEIVSMGRLYDTVGFPNNFSGVTRNNLGATGIIMFPAVTSVRLLVPLNSENRAQLSSILNNADEIPDEKKSEVIKDLFKSLEQSELNHEVISIRLERLEQDIPIENIISVTLASSSAVEEMIKNLKSQALKEIWLDNRSIWPDNQGQETEPQIEILLTRRFENNPDLLSTAVDITVHTIIQREYIQMDKRLRKAARDLQTNDKDLSFDAAYKQVAAQEDQVFLSFARSLFQKVTDLKAERELQDEDAIVTALRTVISENLNSALGQQTRKDEELQSGQATVAASQVSEEKYGGINFDPTLMNLQVKRDKNGVPLPLPQQDLKNINIEGLYPVIINIAPVTLANFPLLSKTEEEKQRIPSAKDDISPVDRQKLVGRAG